MVKHRAPARWEVEQDPRVRDLAKQILALTETGDVNCIVEDVKLVLSVAEAEKHAYNLITGGK